MNAVQILLDDIVLTEIVTEQVIKFCRIVDGTTLPDLVISRVKTAQDVPHLLLGGKKEEGCEVLSLPLRLGDLNDRVRYLLSGRDRFAQDNLISFLNFTLNAEDGIMTDERSAMQIRLTDKEKLIIFSLHAAPSHTLDRAHLLQSVWGYADTAETHTLETHLYRLRLKLEEGLGLKDLIITKDGFYTLKI